MKIKETSRLDRLTNQEWDHFMRTGTIDQIRTFRKEKVSDRNRIRKATGDRIWVAMMIFENQGTGLYWNFSKSNVCESSCEWSKKRSEKQILKYFNQNKHTHMACLWLADNNNNVNSDLGKNPTSDTEKCNGTMVQLGIPSQEHKQFQPFPSSFKF